MKPHISIVVPVHNEEGNILALAQEIVAAFSGSPFAWETIWMDDGSTDRTPQILSDMCAGDPRHRAIHLSGRTGQSAAIVKGLENAEADVLATMDGDGQSDPRDVFKFLNLLQTQRLDMVNGWRKARKDPLKRRLFSRGGNILLTILTGETLHDAGCAVRVFRRGCISDLSVYFKLRGPHRFVPAVARLNNHRRMAELVVNHRVRLSGESKYGVLDRLPEFLHDIWVIFFERLRHGWLPIPSLPRSYERRNQVSV